MLSHRSQSLDNFCTSRKANIICTQNKLPKNTYFQHCKTSKGTQAHINSSLDNMWMYLMTYGSSLPLLLLPLPVVQPQWIQVKMRENGRQLRWNDGPSAGRRDSVPERAAGRHSVPEETVPEDAAVPTVEGASSMRVALLEGSLQPAQTSMLALSYPWEAEYDLSNFNVLYLQILSRWPFCTTILIYIYWGPYPFFQSNKYITARNIRS